jgi:lipopolysaccharide/colanic/teichoic acid biosynthesis glycosyltransferase
MRRRILLSVLAADAVLLAVAFGLATWTTLESPFPWRISLSPSAPTSIWPFAAMLLAGLVIGSLLTAGTAGVAVPRPSYGRAFAIAGITGAFTAAAVSVTRVYHSNTVLALSLGAWLSLALAHRYVRRRSPWTDRMVLVTDEKGLVDDLRATSHADVVAVFDPTGEPPEMDFTDTSLVIDLRVVLSDRMAQFVSSWNLAGYPVRTLTAVYEQHTGRLPIVHLAEGWELSGPVAANGYAPYKRLVDLALALVTAPVWVPLGLVMWVVVKLDSRGPAIFRQDRVGLHGEVFTVYKFRTMEVDAERDGPRFASPNDERLTRTGGWMRRSRLDEIPQMWNVLTGDLSLVGPRPERPEFTERFEQTIPFYQYRHLVRPGMTGWAQVNHGYAGGEAQTVEKLTYDLYYMKHMSPGLDVEILGKSLWTVLSGFGAQ